MIFVLFISTHLTGVRSEAAGEQEFEEWEEWRKGG